MKERITELDDQTNQQELQYVKMENEANQALKARDKSSFSASGVRAK